MSFADSASSEDGSTKESSDGHSIPPAIINLKFQSKSPVFCEFNPVFFLFG